MTVSLATSTTMPHNIPSFGQEQPGWNYIDRPGAYTLIVRGGKEQRILIVDENSGWFLSGGGLEGGEAPTQALQREFLGVHSCNEHDHGDAL